jgi:hypothetical protein
MAIRQAPTNPRRRTMTTRHIVGGQISVCWCGSAHSWTLAKIGYCECRNPTCGEPHRT